MKKTFVIITLIIFFLSIAMIGNAQNLLVHEDFEEGENWNYRDNWGDFYANYLEDEWFITTDDPHTGSYCAESTTPGVLWIEDATFLWYYPQGTTKWFVRMWIKYAPTFNVTTGNFFRFYKWPDTFIEYWGESIHVYGENTLWGGGLPVIKDNQWHEYAIFLDMDNGSLISWLDANGDYTEANTITSRIHHGLIFEQDTLTAVLLPWFDKGSCNNDSCYKFYVDDIEVWDGIPDTSSGVSSNNEVNVNIKPLRIYMGVNYIFFENLLSDDKVTVYNITGKLIHTSESITNNTYRWNISGISNGVYLYKIESEQNINGKVVIIR